ncbi:MAG: metallophosphoesterase [Lachnospiraceae bacterium]|nr:metallophosphoesterase [Lachnospiraceae bacterium]MDD6505239.1 metallophosphoesterase [Lachnospiraceae bacterium]
MKILFLADEEVKSYWDFFRKEDFEDIDIIISCGDLSPSYLSFLTTMTSIPVLYVRGNHDDKYQMNPPEGCICIEDSLYKFNGVRIVGLGGCMRYNLGMNQYTEKEMEKRVKKLRRAIKWNKGVDIVVTHAPARGIHDGDDLCHQGFEVFNDLIREFQPKYFVHGHLHLSYGHQMSRKDMVGETCVINAYEKVIVEI